MEEYFWFISCDSQSERLRKMTSFTEKKTGKPTPPFLSSFRQELFPLPQRESQIFPFFFSIWISIYFSHAKYFDVILYI